MGRKDKRAEIQASTNRRTEGVRKWEKKNNNNKASWYINRWPEFENDGYCVSLEPHETMKHQTTLRGSSTSHCLIRCLPLQMDPTHAISAASISVHRAGKKRGAAFQTTPVLFLTSDDSPTCANTEAARAALDSCTLFTHSVPWC